MKTVLAENLVAGDLILQKNGKAKAVKRVALFPRIVEVLFANHTRVTYGRKTGIQCHS